MERNENTSISSGVTDTSAISQRCNPGALYGGATYHRASRPIGAVLPTRNARLLDHGEYRPRCINVRHAAGHSPDAITPTEIVYCSYIQIKKTRLNVQHQKWLVYRKRAHRRNAYTRAANACHFIIQPLAGGRDVMNTHTNATNNTSLFFIHSSDPVKHTTIVRHQIGRKQASQCVHRSVTATKHQECDAVLSATVDRGLCSVRSLVDHVEQCSVIKSTKPTCCGCNPYESK